MLTKIRIMLLTSLLASISAIAQTITIDSRAFPSGSTPLEPTTTISGTQVTLGAPTTIISNGTTYSFLFWITPCDTPTAANPAPACTLPVGYSSATAWYLQNCVAPCVGGIDTTAFSASDNAALPSTPIAKVVPPNLWTSPSKTVSVSPAQPAVITALDIVDNQNFVEWLQFGSATISGKTLTVPATQSDFAIAFYKQPPDPPVSDPCVGYQQSEAAAFDIAIQNPTPANLNSYHTAVAQYNKCLHCEILPPLKQQSCFNSLGPHKLP